MCIILAESTDTSKSIQGARKFISMEYSKVSHSDGQLFIGADFVVKHEAMSRAVHRFHSESLLFNLEKEEVVLIFGVMTRSLPELEVKHVRGNDFCVASHTVLALDHVNKLVVDDSTHRELEGASRR
jgi:hypothetical protein